MASKDTPAIKEMGYTQCYEAHRARKIVLIVLCVVLLVILFVLGLADGR
ncbi:hypothetical protein [Cryptobacterium curtum]